MMYLYCILTFCVFSFTLAARVNEKAREMLYKALENTIMGDIIEQEDFIRSIKEELGEVQDIRDSIKFVIRTALFIVFSLFISMIIGGIITVLAPLILIGVVVFYAASQNKKNNIP